MDNRNESPLMLLTSSEMEGIAKDALSRVTAPDAEVMLLSSATATATFSRNDIRDVSGENYISISLEVAFGGKRAELRSSRTDPEGLALLVKEAESAAKQHHAYNDEPPHLTPPYTFTDPVIYHEASVAAGAPVLQGDIARNAADMVERAGLTGAGSISSHAESVQVMNTRGLNIHTRSTFAEYSVTGRTRSNTGSGWAWGGHDNFAVIDPVAITARAIDIARRSENPIAVEPGRYTVILEPEAVRTLLGKITGSTTDFMSRSKAERGSGPFAVVRNNMPAGTKLGQQMADRRFQIVSDPMDPEFPYSPSSSLDGPVGRTQWFKDGVLSALSYYGDYGREKGYTPEYIDVPRRAKYMLTGATSTLEQMISSVRRGIWVHRFGGTDGVNSKTLLTTGVTRDGTFLIENGKITKPIKNLRFMDSPFFILNKILAFGPPECVSDRLMVPRLMVRDFEFTGMSEAV